MSGLKIKSLDELIRVARALHGWSRAELARRSGVHKNSLAAYESGSSPPGEKNLERIARALGFDKHELLALLDRGDTVEEPAGTYPPDPPEETEMTPSELSLEVQRLRLEVNEIWRRLGGSPRAGAVLLLATACL